MKLLITYVFFFFILTAVASEKIVAQHTTVSFQVFYDDLSPYGEWVDYPGYGYVWIPYAGPGFTPYSTNGYWVYTDFGWTWVSDYRWGWAPFHYGRWGYDNFYGWYWVPDYTWGPSWVVWRHGPGYYGWAPIGPGVSWNYALSGSYVIPHDHWVFIDDKYIGRKDLHRYYRPRSNRGAEVNNSTIINNTSVDNSRDNATYIRGPRKDQVSDATGKAVKEVRVKESSSPGQTLRNNNLTIYRPKVAEDKTSAKPSRVTERNDIKVPTERENRTIPSRERKTTPRQQPQTPPQTLPDRKPVTPERQPEITPPPQRPAPSQTRPQEPPPRERPSTPERKPRRPR
jgi:hypothetical protein